MSSGPAIVVEDVHVRFGETTGLDPRSRLALWDVIADLVDGGTTLLLTTQYLEEADRLADRIAVVDGGRVIAEGTADALKARAGGQLVAVRVAPQDLAAARVALAPLGEAEQVGDGSLVVPAADGGFVVRAAQLLGDAGIGLDEIALRRPTLDDVVLQLTGHTTDPDEEPATTATASPDTTRTDADGEQLRWLVSDTWALTQRNLRTVGRQPQLLVFATVQPVILILLFRYVFGGAIQAPGEIDHVNHLLTGVFVQTITFAAVQTGIGLSEDVNKGIVDRFKSMPISRGAVLAGRIGADLVRNVVVVLVMVGVGYAVGFRFTGGLTGALLALLLILVWGFVFSWVGALIGLSLRTPETVQAASFPTMFPLVFASSIFVPVQTMPGWLQAFVKVNPITLVTDAVRALALGEPFALFPSLGWAALAMVLVLAVFVPLSVRRYRRT